MYVRMCQLKTELKLNSYSKMNLSSPLPHLMAVGKFDQPN